MEPWLIIVIVTLSLIVVFVLLSWWSYSRASKFEPKLIKELEELEDYEVIRGKRLISSLDELIKHGYKTDTEAYDLISHGCEHMHELNMDERGKYKNMVDMLSFIIGRTHFESKQYGKFIKEEDAVAFKKYHDESDKKYEKYNKVAIRYNINVTSVLTKFMSWIHKEKKVQAIVF